MQLFFIIMWSEISKLTKWIKINEIINILDILIAYSNVKKKKKKKIQTKINKLYKTKIFTIQNI